MLDQIKPLIVVLLIAGGVFAIGRGPVCAMAINRDDFNRRCALWIALTCTLFIASNFWIFMLVSAILLRKSLRHEHNIPALFFFIFFAAPRISAEISGFGLFSHLFAIDYVRLLSLSVLLPAYLVLRKNSGPEGNRWTLTDLFLLAYIAVPLILQSAVDSLTNTMRFGFYAFIDVFLPFYVISRSLKDLQSFRDALASLMTAAMILAAIGLFEFSRHWLLYNELGDALGAPWNLSGYLMRDDSLRAQASTGQPIILGYVMAVGFALWAYVSSLLPGRMLALLGWALLAGGLVVPVSRGPWVGAAVVLLVLVGTGPRRLSRISMLGLLGVAALPILASTTLGEKIIDYLPFVGTVEAGNVTYRERLAATSIEIILQNPFFGSSDFMYQMEDLRTGVGIIDIVNSYASIALSSGLVGLFFFVGVFASVVLGIYKGLLGLSADSELHSLGRALLAAIIGALLIIATVSSISVVAFVYWSLAGLGLAYVRLLASMKAQAKKPVPPQSSTAFLNHPGARSASRQA